MQHENLENGPVRQPHHFRHLVACFRRVHLNLGFVASVNDDADCVLGVSEGHAPEQHVVIGKRQRLHVNLLPRLVELHRVNVFNRSAEGVRFFKHGLHSSVELVDQVVRPVESQFCIKNFDTFTDLFK